MTISGDQRAYLHAILNELREIKNLLEDGRDDDMPREEPPRHLIPKGGRRFAS